MEAIVAATALTEARPTFEDVLTENQSMVFSIALNFLRDRAAADELAQDVFLALHRNMGSIATPDHARNWLRRVTAQRCIDRARRRKVRGEVSLEDAGPLAGRESSADVIAASRLGRLVASLPEQLRAVVILRFQEDMDVEDIGETLGIPGRTARGHLDKAIALLREKSQRLGWSQS